jgi:hypothetical protein
VSSRYWLVFGTALTAFVSVLPQLTALLALSPTQFGVFSIAYLAFAFGVSLSLSIVSEPWSRKQRETSDIALEGYGSASTAIGVAVGVIAAIIVYFMDVATVIAVLSGLGVASTTIRSSMRYLQVSQGHWRQVVRAEAVNLSVFLIGLIAGFMLHADRLGTVVTAWALGGAFSLLVGWPLAGREFGSAKRWYRGHWSEIRPLLRDSLLMDVGAIFAPTLLVAPLGVDGFGTYRAVSNVSAPVRLLFSPLRAVIGQADVSLRRLGDRRALLLYAVGLLTGSAASLVLFLIGRLGWEIGVLSSLSVHAVAVGIFVAGNFLGHYAYIRCRHVGTGRMLLANRLFQTGLMILFPLLGAFYGGLSGAVWGLSLATVISAIGWIIADRPIQKS